MRPKVDCRILAKHFSLFPLLDDESYLLLLIANNCGPTIEKEKASSLFAIRNTKRRMLFDVWKSKKNDILLFFGLSAITLHRSESGCVVLFYYEDIIQNHLKKEENLNFLKGIGYREGSFLKELRHRYQTSCPHEIGIFLGYPIRDVIHFMKNPGSPALKVGYWKVYYNTKEATRTFFKYDEAKKRSVDRTVKWILYSKIKSSKSISKDLNTA